MRRIHVGAREGTLFASCRTQSFWPCPCEPVEAGKDGPRTDHRIDGGPVPSHFL